MVLWFGSAVLDELLPVQNYFGDFPLGTFSLIFVLYVQSSALEASLSLLRYLMPPFSPPVLVVVRWLSHTLVSQLCILPSQRSSSSTTRTFLFHHRPLWSCLSTESSAFTVLLYVLF